MLLLFFYTDSILFCCGILMPVTFGYLVPPASLTSAPYPEWAHYHWVWLSNDRANQSSMMEYAAEYLGHGVQVSLVYVTIEMTEFM